MEWKPVSLAYAACAMLILVYAWNRFNTPTSNRSSTRRALYWSSCLGYMLSALALFAALTVLLHAGPWRTALLGPADHSSLPAPLIATLAMTTLLSSVPALKQLDGWILSVFLDWGAIPAEVKRRAAAMTPQSFSVTGEDVAALRDAYGDGSYGDTLAGHLRERGAEGLELSQYRLTRVVKLYDRIHKLAGEARYARFFAETAGEFAELDRRVAAFLRRSDTSLTLAARLRGLETQSAYEELMQERRDSFAEGCRDIFRELALFLARAVLRSETSEKDIVRRLRNAGFATAEPMNRPDFPIDSLTVLALGMFLYLTVVGMIFAHMPGVPQQPGGGLAAAGKIALARLVAIGVTVWLMQRDAFFRRAPGDPPRFFAYVICGVIASAVAAGVCLVFELGNTAPLSGLRQDLPTIVLSGILCAVVAFCCDDWAEDKVPPAWLRLAEAGGCASVIALGAIIIYFGDLLPFPANVLPHHWMLVAWIVLPSVMALFIGGCVPHIYRSARRAATARHKEASHFPAPAASPASAPATPATRLVARFT